MSHLGAERVIDLDRERLLWPHDPKLNILISTEFYTAITNSHVLKSSNTHITSSNA